MQGENASHTKLTNQDLEQCPNEGSFLAENLGPEVSGHRIGGLGCSSLSPCEAVSTVECTPQIIFKADRVLQIQAQQ